MLHLQYFFKNIAITFCVIALSADITAQTLSEQDQVSGMSAEDTAVLYRQSSFFMMQVHLNQLKDMLDQKQSFDHEKFATTTELLEQLTTMAGNGFADHTQLGLDIPSNAVSDIWQRPDEFRQAMVDLQMSAQKLVKLSQNSSDLKPLQAGVVNVAKACKACHDDFRAN